MHLYILSCTEKENGGGIGCYRLSEHGRLEKEAFFPLDRPMYAVGEQNRLSVLLRSPFLDGDIGGICTVDLNLTNATAPIGTDGIVPCHLCVDGKDAYIVNYLSGNLVRIGKKTVTHKGHGIDVLRQEMPHTHCAIFSPDKRYVLCCDLGLDTLFCYDRDLALISHARIADGYGIRHAIFSHDGRYIYALSEMKPAIHVFSYGNGEIKLITRYDIPCEKAHADGAAIRLSADGKYLYASLRVENAIAVFSLDGIRLTLLQKIDCGGNSPRDFGLTKSHLIVTNERSDNVVVFALQDGRITQKTDEISTPSPLCCVLS